MVETIEDLREVFTKWYKISDEDMELIDITMAAAIDRRIPGDPIWLYIVGPSGFMKTELCRSLGLLPEVYTLDSLTSKALISGLVDKERKPVAGLLKKINNKVLVLKDFTAILSMRTDQRKQVLAQLRNAYDGNLEAGYGTLPEKISQQSNFGLIAAVTPILDSHTITLVTLGPRCIIVRIHNPPRRDAAKAARSNLGKETEMREEVSKAVLSFVESRDYDRKIRISDERGTMIDALADYAAIGRTHVMTKSYGGKIREMTNPSIEAPTRLSKQLTKLGIGLATIRGHTRITNEDYETLKRVAKDTVIPNYQTIIDLFTDDLDKNTSAYGIHTEKRLHLQTTINYLEKMQAIGIVEELTTAEPTKSWRESETPRLWQLTQYYKDTINAAGLGG